MVPAPATPKMKRTPRSRSRGPSASTPKPPKQDSKAAQPETPPSRKRRRASEFAIKSAKRRTPRSRTHTATPSNKARGATNGADKGQPGGKDYGDGEVDDIIRDVRSLIASDTPGPGKQLHEALRRADKEFRVDSTPSSTDEDTAPGPAASNAAEQKSGQGVASVAAAPLALPEPFTPPRADESASARKSRAKTPDTKGKKKRVVQKNDDDSDFESTAQNHRADIDALKRDDPDFYKFLEENDGSLLDFDAVSASDDDAGDAAHDAMEEDGDDAGHDAPDVDASVARTPTKKAKTPKKSKTTKPEEDLVEKPPQQNTSSASEQRSSKKSAKKASKSTRVVAQETEATSALQLKTPTKAEPTEDTDEPEPAQQSAKKSAKKTPKSARKKVSTTEAQDVKDTVPAAPLQTPIKQKLMEEPETHAAAQQSAKKSAKKTPKSSRKKVVDIEAKDADGATLVAPLKTPTKAEATEDAAATEALQQSAKKSGKKTPKSARKKAGSIEAKQQAIPVACEEPLDKADPAEDPNAPVPSITEPTAAGPDDDSVGTYEQRPKKTPKKTPKLTPKKAKDVSANQAMRTPVKDPVKSLVNEPAGVGVDGLEADEATTEAGSGKKRSKATPVKSTKKAKKENRVPLKNVEPEFESEVVDQGTEVPSTPVKNTEKAATPEKVNVTSSSKKRKRKPNVRLHTDDEGAGNKPTTTPSPKSNSVSQEEVEDGNSGDGGSDATAVDGGTIHATETNGLSLDEGGSDSDDDSNEAAADIGKQLTPVRPSTETACEPSDQEELRQNEINGSHMKDISDEEDEESSPAIKKPKSKQKNSAMKSKQSPKLRGVDFEMGERGESIDDSDEELIDRRDVVGKGDGNDGDKSDDSEAYERVTAAAKAEVSAEVADLNDNGNGLVDEEQELPENDIAGYTDSDIDSEEEEEEEAAAAAAGISLEADEMDEEYVEKEPLEDDDTGLDEDKSEADEDGDKDDDMQEEDESQDPSTKAPKLLFVDIKYLRNMKDLLSSKRAGVKACKELLRVFRAGREVLPSDSSSKKKERTKNRRRRPGQEQENVEHHKNQDMEETVDEDDFNDDGSFTAGSVKFASAKAYQQAMNLAIVGIQDALDRMLGKQHSKNASSDSAQGWNPTESGRWEALQTIFRPYVYHMLSLCEAMEDANTLRFLMKRLEKLMPYTANNKSLLKKVVRFAINVFSSEAHNVSEATRLRAYLLLNHMAHGEGNTETVLRSCYNMYSKNIAAACNPKTLPFIRFATSCLVELFGVDIGASYTVAFSYLREMAVALRTVLVSKSVKEDVERIHNWSYVNQLRLWSKVLSKYGSEDELQPLIYPYVQVALGLMKVYPTPRTYPLRLHVASYLSDLVAETGTFIPIVPHLLHLLRCTELKKLPKHGDAKALDWSSLLRVSDDVVKTKPFLTGLVNNCVLQISKFFSAISKHVSFPEISHVVEVTLKKTSKELSAIEWNQKLSALAEKLKQTSSAIALARGVADFSPNGAVSPNGMLAVVPGIDPTKKMPIQVFYEVEKERASKENRLRDKPGSKETSHTEIGNGVNEAAHSDSDREDDLRKDRRKKVKAKKAKKTVASLLTIPGDVDEEDQIAEFNLDSDSD